MGCSMDPSINHAPDIDSIPIIYAFEGVLYTYNVEAADADGDTLVYSLASSPTGMTIDSSTGVISWTPSTVGDYNVTIEVSDGDLFDTQAFNITVSMTEMITLSPPTGVEASEGDADKVQITWNSVTGATHYQVYRADSLTGTKTAISKWQTGTSYNDISATPGITYWYWVKAATSSSGDNASDYSSPVTGVCTGDVPSPLPLYPPYNVSASDLLINKVLITWNIVAGASHYQVYRANNLLATKTAISGWQTGSSYEDTSVAPWTTYWYWVKAAKSSSGDSATGFSIPDTGYAISIVPL
jgi:fibronectin type 3 domain-containing protein